MSKDPRKLVRLFISSCIVLIFLLAGVGAKAQVIPVWNRNDAASSNWVDSVYNQLTPSQRIAQLLMVRANSAVDSLEIRQLSSWIRNYNLGGICFFKGGPVRQAILTNYYQSLAVTPILVSMDAEWGLGMRLDSTMSFARQMTLGAMADESLIYDYGREIARQLRRLGVLVSFSPVADINNNPANPVINIRSFGENKEDVARKSILYMRGLQQGGVMSVAKHFPGHGDTDTDSHLALPHIDHSLETIDTLDLYPFKKLVSEGVDGIMAAHLFVPALDSSQNLPSSLSPRVINDLLKTKLGFRGLVFTDALDMKGASSFAPPGMVEVKALQAGNDILLLPESVDSAVVHISAAIDSGWISQEMIEERCKKVLLAKYRLGLDTRPRVQIDGLMNDLNTPEAELLNRKLYENAITLLKNDDGMLPLPASDSVRIASVSIGLNNETLFQQRLSLYANIDHFTLPREPDPLQVNKILSSLQAYRLVILNVSNTHPSPARNFGISPAAISLIDTILTSRPTILNLNALPYSVQLFRNSEKAKAIMINYQDNPYGYDVSAQMIFGAITAKGKSPVSISSGFPIHSGITETGTNRFKFTLPEDAGIHSQLLAGVDSIALEGIRLKAYPGCQVLIVKDNKVIYAKSFGYHDYSGTEAVAASDIYDLASVTKVAATTLAVMKLHDERKIYPRKPVSNYYPALKNSNKSGITVQETMAHQAGLVAWIPFYLGTIRDHRPDSLIYHSTADAKFSTRVAEGMFIRNDYPSWMLDSITHSPVLAKKEYVYSDLGFILMQQVVERLSGMKLDEYVKKNFYSPMGLPTLGFHPRERFPLKRIIPTEDDTVFRHQIIHGDVHDPTSAMMGGVSGHAGLFSDAVDLASVFQMLLQHGYYNGRHYIDSATVEEFTGKQFMGNRRGMGFDKPQNPGEEGPACADASRRSFGHSGFTGTYVWADPKYQLIFVMLTNRVNPSALDNKLVKLGTRTRIQQVIYDAIKGSTPQ